MRGHAEEFGLFVVEVGEFFVRFGEFVQRGLHALEGRGATQLEDQAEDEEEEDDAEVARGIDDGVPARDRRAGRVPRPQSVAMPIPMPTKKHNAAQTVAGRTPRMSSAQSGTDASQATAWLWMPPSRSVSWVKPAAIVPTTRCPTNPRAPGAAQQPRHGGEDRAADNDDRGAMPVSDGE